MLDPILEVVRAPPASSELFDHFQTLGHMLFSAHDKIVT